jgi:hypothetical protein
MENNLYNLYGWSLKADKLRGGSRHLSFTNPFWGKVKFVQLGAGKLKLSSIGDIETYDASLWTDVVVEVPDGKIAQFFAKLDEKKSICEKLLAIATVAHARHEGLYNGKVDLNHSHIYSADFKTDVRFFFDEERTSELGFYSRALYVVYNTVTEEVAVKINDDMWQWTTTVKYQDFNAEEILNVFDERVCAVRKMGCRFANDFYAAKEELYQQIPYQHHVYFSDIQLFFDVSGANSTKLEIHSSIRGMDTINLVRKNRNLQKLNGAAYFKRFTKKFLETLVK